MDFDGIQGIMLLCAYVLYNNFSAISLYESVGLRKDTMKTRVLIDELATVN